MTQADMSPVSSTRTRWHWLWFSASLRLIWPPAQSDWPANAICLEQELLGRKGNLTLVKFYRLNCGKITLPGVISYTPAIFFFFYILLKVCVDRDFKSGWHSFMHAQVCSESIHRWSRRWARTIYESGWRAGSQRWGKCEQINLCW